MNRIFTLLLLAISFSSFAQHKASVSANSDFKTIHNNVVESKFTITGDLSESEISNFNDWIGNNAAIGTFHLEGNTVTTALKVDFNDRNVYGKMFYMLGIDVLEVPVNGYSQQMDTDQFFDHFNL